MGNWSNEEKMSYEDFLKLFRENICSGWAGENPGGGRSTVLSVSDNGNVCYQRKKLKNQHRYSRPSTRHTAKGV
jgi:hypothetical protein